MAITGTESRFQNMKMLVEELEVNGVPVTGGTPSVAWADVTGKPTFADVATSGSYADLTNTPTLGTAAAADTGDFATAAQGALADSAVQPGDLAAVATSGAYSDLTGTPQGVAVPDATDDAIATVNALLSSLRAAGLIAP